MNIYFETESQEWVYLQHTWKLKITMCYLTQGIGFPLLLNFDIQHIKFRY